MPQRSVGFFLVITFRVTAADARTVIIGGIPVVLRAAFADIIIDVDNRISQEEALFSFS